jgi:signal transduction histidine kinase
MPAEPMVAVCLVVLAHQAWRDARRRSALNRALHEVRRPLQALALSLPRQPAAGGFQVSPVWQAITAVSELDRELNGTGGDRPAHEPLATRLMVEACVRRAERQAEVAGSRIRLRWAGPEAVVLGDATALSGALDNLLLNAIEHGGAEIVVNVTVVLGHVRIEVIDSGWRDAADPRRGPGPSARHGHGLAIADRVAREHGGRIDPDFSPTGSKVTLVLPLQKRQLRSVEPRLAA